MQAKGISIFFGLIVMLFSVKQVLAEQMPVFFYSPPLAHLNISSGFGARRHPIYKVIRHHDGVDLTAPSGTPIYAIFDGRVAFIDSFGGYGKLIVLIHPDEKTSHYAHCKSSNVQVGDVVKQGQVIAKVGNTGDVTGPHLHFEIRQGGKPIDPTPFLAEYFK